MTFRKIKAGRVNFPAEQWVGEPGTIFYDELSGELRLADGVTPGGQYVASIDLLNGLANVRIFNANIDGNLTVLGTTSTQNNQIIDNEQTLTGTLSVTGNASFTGNSIFTGPTEFVGNTNFTGNSFYLGDQFAVGDSQFDGNTTFIGNIDLVGTTQFIGPLISIGQRTSNGNSIFNGSTLFNGFVEALGEVQFDGNTRQIGPLTVDGNVRINGNTTQSGKAIFIVPELDTDAGGIDISGNPDGSNQPQGGVGGLMQLTSAVGTPARVFLDGQNNYPVYIGRRYNGNTAVATQVLNNEIIARWAATAYTSDGWPALSTAKIDLIALENQTGSAQGSRFEFWTSPIGSNTQQRVATVDSASGITSKFVGNLTGNVSGTTANLGGNLTVGGFSTFNGNVDFTANSHFYGEMHVTGPANFDGNIEVSGNTFITGGFDVVGPVTIGGNTTVAGNLIILGDRVSTGNTVQEGDYIVTGNTSLTGPTAITGNVTITGITQQTGNLLITGNTISSGQVRHIISTVSGITSAIEITGNEDGSFLDPTNTGVMLHVTGQANDASRIYNDAQNSFASYVARRYNGNTAQPTQVFKDQDIMRISAVGYANTFMPNFGSSRIVFVANETQTDTAQGGRLEFWTTPNGQTSLQLVANVTNANGIWSTAGFVGTLTGNVSGNISGSSAVFTGNISANNITITNRVISNTAQFSGNVTTAGITASNTVTAPRMNISAAGISDLGANTAPVINFGVHSLVRVTNPAATVAASLTNYVAGAHVRLIVQMTTARQIDLGVATSNNSTIAATSLPTNRISNNQCVIIDYYCVDGTANGTYAAVHYA